MLVSVESTTCADHGQWEGLGPCNTYITWLYQPITLLPPAHCEQLANGRDSPIPAPALQCPPLGNAWVCSGAEGRGGGFPAGQEGGLVPASDAAVVEGGEEGGRLQVKKEYSFSMEEEAEGERRGRGGAVVKSERTKQATEANRESARQTIRRKQVRALRNADRSRRGLRFPDASDV